jgi:hypothetical protein
MRAPEESAEESRVWSRIHSRRAPHIETDELIKLTRLFITSSAIDAAPFAVVKRGRPTAEIKAAVLLRAPTRGVVTRDGGGCRIDFDHVVPRADRFVGSLVAGPLLRQLRLVAFNLATVAPGHRSRSSARFCATLTEVRRRRDALLRRRIIKAQLGPPRRPQTHLRLANRRPCPDSRTRRPLAAVASAPQTRPAPHSPCRANDASACLTDARASVASRRPIN